MNSTRLTASILWIGLLAIPAPECKCVATYTSAAMPTTHLCPNNQVGVQLIFQSPTPQHGQCTQANPCVPQSGCGLVFPQDIEVNLFNCLSGGAWAEVTGYNNGQRFFIVSGETFDMNITGCKCYSSNEATPSAECEKTLKLFSGQTGGAPFFEWKAAIRCDKCHD